MSEWVIEGESGKSLGYTGGIDLAVTGYSGVQLTRTNQGTDTLSFFIACTERNADPAYLPEYGQEISLFRGGVRQFYGFVGKPKFILQGGLFGWQIEAQYGWQELDRVALTSGDTEYSRAQGDLRDTLIDISVKAIAGGARISLGNFGVMFNIPAIAFRGTSCGAALIELLRICADAVAYFDHDTAGFPALHILRRGSMTPRTFTFGVDDLVEPFSCSPIPGVTPTKVTVAYATRNANGIVTEQIQSAGSGSDVQSVILTASNFADFQAKATAAQVTLQTSTVASWSAAYALDTKIKGIVGIPAPDGIGSIMYCTGDMPSNKTVTNTNGLPAQWLGLTAPNSYPLISGEWRDYMAKALGMTRGECPMEADFFWKVRRTVNGVPVDKPEWLMGLEAAGAVDIGSSFIFWVCSHVPPGSLFPYPGSDRAWVYRYRCTFKGVAISRNLPAATILQDPGDYGTTAPPATLAADLLAAQAFVPYEGQFALAPGHTPEFMLNKKISFGGLTARLSSIGAAIQSETLDIASGAKSLQMGLPVRQGPSALTRLRKLSE